MQNKSICIMTSVHPHDDVRIYHKQAKSLRQAGFDVTIICTDFEGVDDVGIKFVKLDIPKKRMSRIMKASNIFYNKAVELNCDYYHFHDPELIKAGLKLSKKGKRVIYDVHEDVPRQILNKPYLRPFIAKISSSYFEGYEHRSVKKLYAVITATPFISERLKRYNKNTVTVCNYPRLSEFEDIEIDYSHKSNNVCYVGGITKIRGIFEMLNAMENTDATLILAGEFETPQLKEQALLLPGYQKTNYLGFLGRKEISDVLKCSKAGLVTLRNTPAYRDSIPVKMFEYMAAGLPVIASDFPYWRSIVEDAKCGVCVDPSDSVAISNAIEFLLNNEDKAIDMGKNGRNAVLNRFNWDIEKVKLLELYTT